MSQSRGVQRQGLGKEHCLNQEGHEKKQAGAAWDPSPVGSSLKGYKLLFTGVDLGVRESCVRNPSSTASQQCNPRRATDALVLSVSTSFITGIAPRWGTHAIVQRLNKFVYKKPRFQRKGRAQPTARVGKQKEVIFLRPRTPGQSQYSLPLATVMGP